MDVAADPLDLGGMVLGVPGDEGGGVGGGGGPDEPFLDMDDSVLPAGPAHEGLLGDDSRNVSITNEMFQGVIMSMMLEKDQVAAVIYNEQDLSLAIFESWEDKSLTYLGYLKHLVRPETVVISSRTDAVTQAMIGEDGTKIKTMSAATFSAESGKMKLAQIAYPANAPINEPPEKRILRVSSMINSDNPTLLRALGGLIGYIQQRQDHTDKVLVNHIDYLSAKDVLVVDASSLAALQIFKPEQHPSAHGIGNSKEGMSLFGILDKTSSPQGRTQLKKWMLRPLRDALRITERLDCISFFSQPNAKEFVDNARKLLRKCSDLTHVCGRVRTYQCSVTDWEHLFKTISSCSKIKQLCQQLDSATDVYVSRDILTTPTGIFELVSVLDKTIDFPSSQAEKRLVLLSGVNDEIDELKHTLAGLDSMLTLFGEEEMARRPTLPALKIIYFPQIGYHMAIPINPEKPIEQQWRPAPDLEYKFHTDTYLYFKDDAMNHLDTELGDLHHKIVDMEARAARQLAEYVRDKIPALLELNQYLAALDCMLALTVASTEYGYTRPIITAEHNVIYIQNGRHPIQELCLPEDTPFVPNDTALAYGREGCLKVITGPNSSGKSIYLKQVALITYMAHLGCFVPATAAMVGLVDRIFTRVISYESIFANKSSFLLDLNSVSMALRCSTERSLFIIDEFGKGTDRLDGIALMDALLNHFIRLEKQCPKILICTHFHELLGLNGLQQPEIEHLTMDVVIHESVIASAASNSGATSAGTKNLDRLVFLYKLSKKSAATSSFGMYCAFMAGVPVEILQRSAMVSQKLETGDPIVPIQANPRDTEKLWKLFQEFDCETGDIDAFLDHVKRT